MVTNVEKLSQLLALITHALDAVTELLESADTDIVRKQAAIAEDCLHLLSHVQQAILVAHPEIAPVWTKQDTAFGEMAREYGRLLLASEPLWTAGKYDEAEQLWRDYLATEPFYSSK